MAANEPRARILAAAREIFLDGGADAVTMRAVAERVGVSATALYRHFENKDALVRAVMTAGFESFAGYLYRALSGKTPGERLRLSGVAYLDFALEQPQMYRTVFMTAWPRAGTVVIDPQWGATFHFLVDRVRECMDSRDLRKDEPTEVARTIWAQVHGLVSLYLIGSTGLEQGDFRELYRLSLQRLFKGLLP